MDKQKVMHLYNGILVKSKRKQTTNMHNEMNEC